ncbi:hypothetical protein HJG60_016574 [Phyllostomus discolor]|uniref:60S ribosomal protein L29 n=1 Tax=Phyllostomus discolor TaxID=89673 RepID=A0A834B1C3_9CHIR|nr:hypothetical protein HJG60_016574 [Phyllostomus discolor]
MQANNTKAMSACAEALKVLVKPKESKSKIPKGSSHKLSLLVCITHTELEKCGCALNVKGLRLCWPKSKAKFQPSLRLLLRLKLSLPNVPQPPSRCHSRVLWLLM